MEEHTGETIEPLTYGCMECKAQQPYTVEQFQNGNTGWRCTVCGKIARLIPGHYSEFYGLGAAEGPA
jgi:hypothetical protein